MVACRANQKKDSHLKILRTYFSLLALFTILGSMTAWKSSAQSISPNITDSKKNEAIVPNTRENLTTKDPATHTPQSAPANHSHMGKRGEYDVFEEEPDVYWYIYHYSAHYGVDPLLVRAVIQVESAFDPDARSKHGAMGLMQITKVTAKHLGLKNPFDIRENIEGGTRYLGELLKRHNWNLRLALASYNAGPAAVAQLNGAPPSQGTQQYVRKVLIEYRKLKSAVEKMEAHLPSRNHTSTSAIP